ncbi:hypothetical protein VTN31DRAFT_6755 [Thermomyces dupontii]|uniref:uncharacterized protein n=1 Tax=Talaromyces thermophilus TaxID=28565 RepID=UPI00374244DA
MASDMHSYYTTSSSTLASRSPPIMDELISKYSSGTGVSSMPTSSPRRGLVRRIIDRVRLEYYRYEVTFGVYVMTPGEKFVANTFVVLFLSLLLWASFLYFPQLLIQKLGRLIWILTGRSEDLGAVLGFFDQGYRTASTASAGIPASTLAS